MPSDVLMDEKNGERLPLVPLRGTLAFPNMAVCFDVGRDRSLKAVERAISKRDGHVLLVAQRNVYCDDPVLDDLYGVGTTAVIKHVLRLPDNTERVFCEGESRVLLLGASLEKGCLEGEYVAQESLKYEDTLELKGYMQEIRTLAQEVGRQRGRIAGELMQAMDGEADAGTLADLVASNVLKRFEDKQTLLECRDVLLRLKLLSRMLAQEVELAQIERRIDEQVKASIDQHQREYFLREQIRAIQTELGDDEQDEMDELNAKLAKSKISGTAREKVERELDRYSRMQRGTPEATVSRNYIDWMLDMPWGVYVEGKIDLARARRVLDADHYGLEKVKERILEYLAVMSMKGELKGQILCLVGPPGVGKTSVARSVARALKRKFTRMALGGMHDEAELRGHRRTYVGAVPGRIAASIKQCGALDPVFLLDEIDKLSSDFRGDPSSALLEALDPEQNSAFNDNYLDAPLDLSRVMFITTANTLDDIPPALADRMEIIEVSSYTLEEKVQIAKRHLIKKQLKEHGLDRDTLRVSDKAIEALIARYTREAGVRELERELGALCRKAVVKLLSGEVEKLSIKPQDLDGYLGAPRYISDKPLKSPETGVVNGLAFTQVGGVTMPIEVAVMPGGGAVDLTGRLGDVMKESARTAYSYIRSRAKDYNIPDDFSKNNDVHIHVPEGAVPKDGPSAGVALTCAMLSAMTGRPARQDVAMTGEVTLRGRVLPIGGVKEKLLAAHRMGIDIVLLPEENEKDLSELPGDVRSHMDVRLIGKVDQAINIVLDAPSAGAAPC